MLGTVGRTAVVAGTATATANAVNRHAQNKAAEKERAAANEAQEAAPPPPAPVAPAPAPAPAAGDDLISKLTELASFVTAESCPRRSSSRPKLSFSTRKTSQGRLKFKLQPSPDFCCVRRRMATLTVWKFADPSGAEKALETLEGLQKQALIEVLDGAVVSWPLDKKKPKTRQLHSTTGAGALGGAFWGLLFGLIFFIPLVGAAIGAATGALVGSMTDVGISDDFIKACVMR